MRVVIQRVKRAKVTAYREDVPEIGEVTGEIGAGLMVLVGVSPEDGDAQIEKTARKIAQLKLLRGDASDDPAQRVSAQDSGAPVLLVSQFTLYADVRKGTKPGWSHAAPGPVAEPIFDRVVEAVRGYGIEVSTGRFGAMMDVELVNDGPFTILVEV
ncbi:D-tyrosyl-tRNA(Tyr) deacylase [Arcanobacterium wilhelmae]|uniref:D-aminoacyl-tRNA deacylase n=1 Tax=Arcanobacterium wilhelmae TaxID=1803177 RepID=A0ABT9NAB3_9ACTO|nr:D-aminoacyl-tRNA deacylase [Arcanobacterium wilhelmae]MDP9800649.1 D-tyrosyl-tRNA(Tyr) deacylase [Arcanobacterium wilhelmae]WFN90052.1 D-aminoacyl-tRNA deacylase [Arcanobacterium wilhelmae]